MASSGAHDHGGPTAVDVEAEAGRGLRGLGALLLVLGALCTSGGAWLLLRSRGTPLVERSAASLRYGRPDQALELARQAVEEQPESAAAWLAQARALRATGRTEEARASLARACELEPEDWRPRLELAELCLEVGDREGARAALERARALAPEEAAVRALEAELPR